MVSPDPSFISAAAAAVPPERREKLHSQISCQDVNLSPDAMLSHLCDFSDRVYR